MVLLIISGYANLCGLFKLVWFQGLSALQRVSVLHSFVCPTVALCGRTPGCLPIQLMIDIWAVPSFRLPWILPLAVSLLEYAFLILLGIYLRVGSLDHVSFMFLTFFWLKIFPKRITDPLAFENGYMEHTILRSMFLAVTLSRNDYKLL